MGGNQFFSVQYGISQPAAHKRLKKIEEKIKKLVIDF